MSGRARTLGALLIACAAGAAPRAPSQEVLDTDAVALSGSAAADVADRDASGAAPGDADDDALGDADADGDAPDQTEQRERWAIIPTIYGDVRRPDAFSMPALAPDPPSGSLDWSFMRTAVAWPAGSAPAGEGSPSTTVPGARTERRCDASMRWEMGLGAGICVFAAAPAARDDRTRSTHVGDPTLDVQAPLWSSRYAACALSLGGAAPVDGSGARDWLLDHGSVRGGGWSGRMSLAGCGGLGLCAVQGRLLIEGTPRGENSVRAADGITTTIRHRTGMAEATLGATWRATTWLRAGAEADGWQRRWHARAGDSLGSDRETLRVEACDLALVAELTPLAGWSVRAEGGMDAIQGRLLRARDRVIAGGGLDWAW